MAGLAIHVGTVKQLGLRNMVGRFGKRAGRTLGGVAAVVARLASGGRHDGMVHRDRCCEAGLRTVARVALCNASRHRNVGRRLALGGCTVVAGITGTGAHGIRWRVGKHHCQPAGG